MLKGFESEVSSLGLEGVQACLEAGHAAASAKNSHGGDST